MPTYASSESTSDSSATRTNSGFLEDEEEGTNVDDDSPDHATNHAERSALTSPQKTSSLAESARLMSSREIVGKNSNDNSGEVFERRSKSV